MQHQYPCNRFGFGLNHNYAPMHHQGHHEQSYQNAAYSSGASGAVQQQQHKPTNPWPMGHAQFHDNFASATHQVDHSGTGSSARDLPLTPPAEREATPASPASYYALHGASPVASGSGNVNSFAHYSPPPVDKSATPPQEVNFNHHHHHHQMATNQIQDPAVNSSLGGWWTPTNQSTDFYHHHHHQMVPTPAPPAPDARAAPASVTSHQEPTDFQQRVAAALLKTHATLASRRCRRCRCPNCQVMTRRLFSLKRSLNVAL